MQDFLLIATWNVNSVRARLACIEKFLKESNTDILMMQETKCQNKDFPENFFNELGYNVYFSGQPSYNGVAIASKLPLEIEHDKLPLYNLETQDQQARYIEGTLSLPNKTVRVASIYVPNGDGKLEKGQKLHDSPKFQFKLRFFDRLIKRMKEIKENENEVFIYGGDYNVAHTDIDLHNPKSARGGVGFHPMEIEKIDQIIGNKYMDLFRKFNTNAEQYSWWDYRHSGWLKNKGWRIDYIFTLEDHLKQFSDCYIEKMVRGWEKTSDHVPVVSKLKIS